MIELTICRTEDVVDCFIVHFKYHISISLCRTCLHSPYKSCQFCLCCSFSSLKFSHSTLHERTITITNDQTHTWIVDSLMVGCIIIAYDPHCWRTFSFSRAMDSRCRCCLLRCWCNPFFHIFFFVSIPSHLCGSIYLITLLY